MLIIGGSRSQRFDPVYARKLTHLDAFNAAVQNCRPEDAFAFSSYLFSKQPTEKVHLMFALAATTFSDIDMAPGLLWDERLSQWFPNALIQNQQQKTGTPPWRDMPGRSRYTDRGMLTHNNYDVTVASGKTLDQRLSTYLARMLPIAAAPASTNQTRSKEYFTKLLKLYNDHGVKPLIVIMPYQPRVLAAFRSVGWQRKLNKLLNYLHFLKSRYQFHVLDFTSISSFHGNPNWFYDGAHIMRGNADLLLKQAVHSAPECFR